MDARGRARLFGIARNGAELAKEGAGLCGCKRRMKEISEDWETGKNCLRMQTDDPASNADV